MTHYAIPTAARQAEIFAAQLAEARRAGYRDNMPEHGGRSTATPRASRLAFRAMVPTAMMLLAYTERGATGIAPVLVDPDGTIWPQEGTSNDVRALVAAFDRAVVSGERAILRRLDVHRRESSRG